MTRWGAQFRQITWPKSDIPVAAVSGVVLWSRMVVETFAGKARSVAVAAVRSNQPVVGWSGISGDCVLPHCAANIPVWFIVIPDFYADCSGMGNVD